MKEDAVIWDLDGVLCDVGCRLNLIHPELPPATRYDQFHEASRSAPCLDQMIELNRRLYDSGLVSIILTGRPDKYRSITREWLGEHRALYHLLFMRPDPSCAAPLSDAPYKAGVYRAHIRPNYNVLYAFEDRDKIVDMWRDLGITCLQPCRSLY